MTAEEYLAAITAKNPALARPDNETITLTARGLRALIRQAHAKGEEHGSRNQSNNSSGSCNPFAEIFGWGK